MSDNIKAKIFLASERGHAETEWFRTYTTFNLGQFNNEHKKPFGVLYVLNDETLAGGKSLQLAVEEDTVLIIIPTIESINYKDSILNETALEAGQCQLVFLPKDAVFQVANPYQTELVNFIHCWFKASLIENKTAVVISFDALQKNSLQQLAASKHINCFLGKYDGRSEDIYHSTATDKSFFVFIIEGAFEVQNRLLETRDGLALTGVDVLEFEALSNDAIIVVLEIPGAAL